MSKIKEIRTKIASIKSTQKITSAMEMVAASKMRKAHKLREKGKRYATSIRKVVGHIAHADTEYSHPYMLNRPKKRVGYIIVSSDRGLCGGLNTNLFKHTILAKKNWHKQNIEIDLFLIGNKAVSFFNSYGGNIVATMTHLTEEPSSSDLLEGIQIMLDSFRKEEIDSLYLVYNEFVSAMIQKPIIQQLLPLEILQDSKLKNLWDYIYEPDPKTLLDGLLLRYIETQLYQAIVENYACEQAARIIAMKNATENADNLIDDLQLLFNKVRQSSITQELSEIVSGASAV